MELLNKLKAEKTEFEYLFLLSLKSDFEKQRVLLSEIDRSIFEQGTQDILLCLDEQIKQGSEFAHVDLADIYIPEGLEHKRNDIIFLIETLKRFAENAPNYISYDAAKEVYKGIKNNFVRIYLINEAEKLYKKAHRSDIDSGALIAELERIAQIKTETAKIGGLNVLEILRRDSEQKHREPLNIGELSDFYGDVGKHKGTTEVIMGHPKHGKTSYAIYKASQMLKNGLKGLWVVLEDTDSNLAQKMFIQTNDSKACENLIVIDRMNGATDLDSIITHIKYYNATKGLDFFVLDYIQRCNVKGISYADEVSKVQTVSSRLTDLANEENLFAILLAQPHRIDKTLRGWKMEPNAFNLQGSSQIEKDAFVITSVYRPCEVDDLVKLDAHGRRSGVTGFNGQIYPINSVFVRQKTARYETEKGYRVFLHTDEGFKRYFDNPLQEPVYTNGKLPESHLDNWYNDEPDF